VLSKSIGSNNPHNVVKAAFEGLNRACDAVMIARKRNVKVFDLFK
jgi:small subunit ribosomal protein S5